MLTTVFEIVEAGGVGWGDNKKKTKKKLKNPNLLNLKTDMLGFSYIFGGAAWGLEKYLGLPARCQMP